MASVETTKGWKVQRESDGKRVRIQMYDCVGAFLAPARHRKDMALRHRGAHGDNYEVQ